jgi:ribosome maturation factor RimP
VSKKLNIESYVEELVQPIVDEHGFELVDVEYVREMGQWYLRVFVDKEGGIFINDCETVSRALDAKMEENNPIKESYILEVSSPGLDRPLKKAKDFERSIGKKVEVKLYKPLNGSKLYEGILEGFTDDTVEIRIDSDLVTIERSAIALIRLAFEF